MFNIKKDKVTLIDTEDDTVYGYMVNEYKDVVLVKTIYDNVKAINRHILERQSMVLSDRILMLGMKLSEVPIVEDNEGSDIDDSIYQDIDLNKFLEDLDTEFVESLKKFLIDKKEENNFEQLIEPYFLGIKAALKEDMLQFLMEGYVHLWTSGRKLCTHYYGRRTRSNHLQIKCIQVIEPLDKVISISNMTVHANVIKKIFLSYCLKC